MKSHDTLEIEVLLNDLALSYGSTPAQAVELGDNHAGKFELRSGELIFKPTDTPPTREIMERAFPVQIPTVDALQTLEQKRDKAFLGRGNLGMRATLRAELGEAQLNEHAKRYGCAISLTLCPEDPLDAMLTGAAERSLPPATPGAKRAAFLCLSKGSSYGASVPRLRPRSLPPPAASSDRRTRTRISIDE